MGWKDSLFGVKLISIYYYVSGTIFLFAGLILAFSTTSFLGSMTLNFVFTLSGLVRGLRLLFSLSSFWIMILLYSILNFAFAFALNNGRNYVRRCIIGLSLLNLIIGSYVLFIEIIFSGTELEWDKMEVFELILVLGGELITLVINLVIGWYLLFNKKVKEYFSQSPLINRQDKYIIKLIFLTMGIISNYRPNIF